MTVKKQHACCFGQSHPSRELCLSKRLVKTVGCKKIHNNKLKPETTAESFRITIILSLWESIVHCARVFLRIEREKSGKAAIKYPSFQLVRNIASETLLQFQNKLTAVKVDRWPRPFSTRLQAIDGLVRLKVPNTSHLPRRKQLTVVILFSPANLLGR